MTELERWYLRANRKYVWNEATIRNYVPVLGEVVRGLVAEYGSERPKDNLLISPEIGFFRILGNEHSDEGVFGFAVYISDMRLPGNRSTTLFAEFKRNYQLLVGAVPFPFSPFHLSDESLKEKLPDFADRIISLKKERLPLVRSFISIANRSLTRRRIMSARTRYLVLERDNSICRKCGRRPPEVRVHVDHIEPVSWESQWEIRDGNLDDYQVLCEECNLGKGDLSWLTL